MTTQPPDLKKLREVRDVLRKWGTRTVDRLPWPDAVEMAGIIDEAIDAYEASARDAEAFRAALEVEQVDLDFTIQAIVCRDPLEEIHLRVRDQKRRVTDALNAARHATQGD